jgi:hypothetical protein
MLAEGRPAGADLIKIKAFLRIMTGVEAGGNFLCCSNAYVRRKAIIKILFQESGGHWLGRLQMSDLAQCMDSRIRSSGTCNLNGSSKQILGGIPQFSLDGPGI